MNIKKFITLILSLILILSSFVGCRKMGENNLSSANTSDISSEIYSIVDVVIDESSQDETVSDTDSNTNSDNESLTTSQNSSNSGGSTSSSVDSSNDNTTSVEEPIITVNPSGNEIYGQGSKDSPYEDTPDAEKQTVTTVSIPAGKSVFYNIYRVGGRWLTINSDSVYVVCDGKKYTPKNGKVSFKVVDALASDAVSFEIGNTGSVASNFTIAFLDEQGSMANPEELINVADKITTVLAKGNDIGYFYKYKAEKTGKLHFYLTATNNKSKPTNKSEIRITNNSTAGTIQVFSGDEDLTDNLDDSIYELEINVTQGDEIVIHMGIVKSGREYPETTIEWYAEYK